MLKGGWWWKSCGRGLNGLYLNDPQDLTARQGKKKKNGADIGNLVIFDERLSVFNTTNINVFEIHTFCDVVWGNHIFRREDTFVSKNVRVTEVRLYFHSINSIFYTVLNLRSFMDLFYHTVRLIRNRSYFRKQYQLGWLKIRFQTKSNETFTDFLFKYQSKKISRAWLIRIYLLKNLLKILNKQTVLSKIHFYYFYLFKMYCNAFILLLIFLFWNFLLLDTNTKL